MNTGTDNTNAAGAPATVQQLVADHINAVANHERLFQLQDWGLALEDETRAALGPINDALIAICAARPIERPQIALRRSYLQAVIPDYLEGDKDRAVDVVRAFLGEGTPSTQYASTDIRSIRDVSVFCVYAEQVRIFISKSFLAPLYVSETREGSNSIFRFEFDRSDEISERIELAVQSVVRDGLPEDMRN